MAPAALAFTDLPGERLQGKSVIVTGGLSGIGFALVRFFASYSTAVTILDISRSSVSTTLSSLENEFPKSTFRYAPCDISSWDQQLAVFEDVYGAVGKVDIVCANAGVSDIGKFLKNEPAECQKPDLRTLDINLTGTLYTIKLAIHYMRKNKTQEKGMIICTASNAGLYAFPIAPVYGVSKHGIVGAVRSLSKPLKEERIRINALCPNCITTGLADDNLFSNMTITPMSTLINAVEELVSNEDLTGITAEISGENFSFREAPEHVDAITTENLKTFERLGYA